MTKHNAVQYLESFNLLTPIEIQSFLDLTTQRHIKKGDYFIRESETCQEVAFIIDGYFRSFYYSSSSEEVTYCFTFKNSFITAYSSLISGDKTAENIQALTDVQLLSISKTNLESLENSSTNWLRLLKTIAEQEYLKMEQRIFILQKENAEKKYANLIEQHPEYLHNIPLNYLASYLGITQRHLSRIRRNFSN